MISLQLKSMFVASPVEGLAKRLQWAMSARQRTRHPELWGIYEEGKLFPMVLRRLLESASRTLDVGAHIGSFLSEAMTISPEGHHAAIEASPTKAAWLEKKFPRARIYPVAVSDHTGTATFEENLRNPGFSKLADGHGSGDPVDSYKVNVTTLDALDLGKVDLMKIDIEGAELAAFKGGEAFIARNRPKIILECGTAYNAGLDRFALYDHLTELGYQVFSFSDFLYDKGPLSRDEFRKCGLYPFRAFNFVALPN